MSHLGDERLIELGLDLTAVPSAVEGAHLADCPTCSRALATERALTRSLAIELPRAEPPRDFVAATSARFAATRRALEPRRTLARLALALVASLVVAVPSVWVIALHAGDMTRHFAIGAKEITVLASAASVVADKIPLVPVLFAGLTATLLLGASIGLGQLAEASRRPIAVAVRA